MWWSEEEWGGGRSIWPMHNNMHDVTRASLNKDGQNLLTKHFLRPSTRATERGINIGLL
jgi:hypothetical protein